MPKQNLKGGANVKQQDIIHNSFEDQHREPFGAVPRGSTVTLRIDIHQQYSISKVILHYIFDKSNDEHTKEMDLLSKRLPYDRFEVMIKMPSEPQLVWYYFEIITKDTTVFYGRLKEESGEGMVYDYAPPSWQITVYNPDYQTPNWWKHATMYQIFPDRFHVSGEPALHQAPKGSLMHSHWDDEPVYIKNEKGEVIRWDFFGGNLKGIMEKLDYLKSLDVTVLYVNPIFEAESNHRYDTGDYHKVDPLLGSEDDLKQLIKAAKEHQIEIMLDGVFSHTGSNSLYFNQKGEYETLGAYQSTESPYYSWYTFHRHPDEYDSWWGVKTLPTVKKDNKDYQSFLIHDEKSVIKSWQKVGIKHWRLDVADELTDDLIRQIYGQLKAHDAESVLLGEVWEDASNKMAYGIRRDYFLGGVLDSVMNYPLRAYMLAFIKGEIDAYTLQRKLLTLYEHYPKQSFYSVMNLLSSHDVERIKTLLDGYLPSAMSKTEKERIVNEKLRALSLWLYTFPGIPSLYYGDEAGLTGGKDPDNRKPYPWGREDQGLVTWYQTIGHWRRTHPALRTGNFRQHALNKDVFGFERWTNNGVDEFGDPAKDEHFLYLFNRNNRKEREVTLPIRKGKWVDMRNEKRVFRILDVNLTIQLKPCESMLLKYV